MIKKWFKQFILENKFDICTVAMLLIIGFICGIGIYFIVNDNTTNDLLNTVREVFNLSAEEKIVKSNVIMNSLKLNLMLVLLLLFFSITLIGKWCIYFVTIFKGVAVGMYTSILFAIFGFWWGLVAVLLLVVLVNIVYIPTYIYISTTLLAFNFELFNTKKDTTNLYCVTKTLTKLAVSFAFVFSSGILEQVLTNVVFKIYEKI